MTDINVYEWCIRLAICTGIFMGLTIVCIWSLVCTEYDKVKSWKKK